MVLHVCHVKTLSLRINKPYTDTECPTCKTWWHKICTALSEAQFNVLANSGSNIYEDKSVAKCNEGQDLGVIFDSLKSK